MIKSLARRAAVVLAGGAIGLTAATLPAQAATTGWRVNADIHTRGNVNVLFGGDAVTARDAWATGVSENNKKFTFRAILRRWTGTSWHSVTLPAGLAKRWNSSFPTYTKIAASSARDVWVFNSLRGGAYLHLTGSHWSMGSLPGRGASPSKSLEITAAEDFGKRNAWAFGARVNLASPTPTAVPYAAHFNGRGWTGQTLPGKGQITAVGAVSASSAWAVVGRPGPLGPGIVGGSTRPLVLHWTATTGWQQAAIHRCCLRART